MNSPPMVRQKLSPGTVLCDPHSGLPIGRIKTAEFKIKKREGKPDEFRIVLTGVEVLDPTAGEGEAH